MTGFSNAVAIVVGDVVGGYYYHHTTLERLFAESGAPGDVPQGNCVEKSVAWLKRVATDPTVEGLPILGALLEQFMDTDIQGHYNYNGEHAKQQARVRQLLLREGLEYVRGGRVMSAGSVAPARQLEAILRERDLGGVNTEFERALDSVHSDPGAAVTAACAIIESLCKVYIGDRGLELPQDQSVSPLWKVVQADLGFDPRSIADNDIRQILAGLSSIVHGLGAFRTHVGSAHGRGRTAYRLTPRHASLVVGAAHTLAIFIIKTWDERVGQT